MAGTSSRRVIISADDFGMSPEVNEAIEQAHREGLLSTASLMVAGPAAGDAITRARRLPGLRVGLHLVVIEGRPCLPPDRIPRLVDRDGNFPSDQLGLGLRYFFDPRVRRELDQEIAAQFDAFTATGLRLDHANAHKHMHLHPTVGRMLITHGQHHGLHAVRTPCEPAAPLRRADGTPDRMSALALRLWTGLLRRQIRKAGLVTNRSCFGLAWSGAMTTERVARLAASLPPGLSEIYFHPATERNTELRKRMPHYAHDAELAALTAPAFREALRQAGVRLSGWEDAGRAF